MRRANETLDWIEQRQGPLPEAGYARIQTTVGQVRAMAEGQDERYIERLLLEVGEFLTRYAWSPVHDEARDLYERVERAAADLARERLGQGATLLCDGPVAVGKTCDRPICVSCATHDGPDRDYCRDCARDWPGRLA